MYKVGDFVIFRMSKCTSHPGPRAREVFPAPHGELYTYDVDKFWVVVDTTAEDEVVLQTRRGKQHRVKVDAPRLRRASWWERLLYRGRFPQMVVTARAG